MKIHVKDYKDNSCKYCHKDIDTEDAGWGFMIDNFDKQNFHMECLEVSGEIV